MPFVKKIETETGILGIWKLTEPSDLLLEQFLFSEKEKEEYGKLKVEKRKSEYLSVRLLLEKLICKKPDILYEESGKPKLNNDDRNISISHSSELVTVLISKQNIGIDVENTGRNIQKIANRFLHRDELKQIKETGDSQITKTLYWSAKEAIFKTGGQGILFDRQIIIKPFKIGDEGSFSGKLIIEDKSTYYRLWYFFFENNVVVYCVEERNE